MKRLLIFAMLLCAVTARAQMNVTIALDTPHTVDATPTFSPVAGSYSSTQTVTISTTTPGAYLLYCQDTINTCTPATLYSSPVSVSSTGYLRAIACEAGALCSAVGSAVYTIASGITYIGTTPCTTQTGTTGTISYTPAATGHTLLVGIFQPSIYSAPTTVKDNLGNSLTALGGMAGGYVYLYGELSTPSGVTAINTTMSSGTQVICVLEYANVVHFGAAFPTTNGTSASYTNTLASSTGTNNWFVSQVDSSPGETATATVGYLRVGDASNRFYMQDNTVTGSGVPIVISGTLSGSVNWRTSGVELKSQ